MERIKVYYADSVIGINLCAILCQIGYTVIIDKFYKNHPILYKFHNLIIDEKGKEDWDFTFDNQSECDRLITSAKYSPAIFEYIKSPEVEVAEFVCFVIYHWNLLRSNRGVYFSPVIVDQKKIKDWQLMPLIHA